MEYNEIKNALDTLGACIMEKFIEFDTTIDCLNNEIYREKNKNKKFKEKLIRLLQEDLDHE